MKLFNKRKANGHFQTRHTEAVVTLDNQRVLNVAHDVDRNVCIVVFGSIVKEYSVQDAIKHLRNLSQEFENAAKHIEGENV